MQRRAAFWIPVILLIGCIIFLFCRVLFYKGSPADSSLLDQLTSFRCNTTLTYGDMEATAEVVRSADGCIRVTMLTPEALSGVQFDFSQDEVSLNFKGLKLDVEPSSFLASSAASALAGAFDTVLKEGLQNAVEQGGNLLVSSKSSSGSFDLALDPTTGEPVSLDVPSIGLHCTFSDFSLNETSG